jgi:hypothetical protein
MVNRTQALALGFLLMAFMSLLVILVAAPEVHDQALRLPTGHGGAELASVPTATGSSSWPCPTRIKSSGSN